MLAHRIGAPHTVIVTGAFCVAGIGLVHARAAESQSGHAADLPGNGVAAGSRRITDGCRARTGIKSGKEKPCLSQNSIPPALVVIDLQKGIAGLRTVHLPAKLSRRTAQLARAFRERWPSGCSRERNRHGAGRTEAAGPIFSVSAGLDRTCSRIGGSIPATTSFPSSARRVHRHISGRLSCASAA